MGAKQRDECDKKLIYVVNYVHPDDAQHFVHVLGLLRTLRERCGWEIALLSEKGGEGIQNVLGHPVRYLSRDGKVSRLIALAAALVGLRREGYRLVFVRISKPAALTSITAGALLGLRTLFWFSSTNFDLDRGKPLLHRWRDDLMLKAVIAGAERFVTGPEHMLHYYAETYAVPRDKLLLLYNDVDLARFVPPAAPHTVGRALKVLFVHSLSPSKAATLYMPAIIARLNALAAEGRKVEFDLIGDGPERAQIAAQIEAASAGAHVRMMGAVPNIEMPKYMAEADLFIMPSYREGMPRALLEAMAMGLPAVATDAGGTRDLVGPLQLAYVVSRDDPEGFADRMLDLLRDPFARRAIGAENLDRAQRYSTPVVADMYDRALSALL